MKCKIIVGALLCGSSLALYAGVWQTTVHSRANCANNESITWFLGHNFNWKVASVHKYKDGGGHVMDTGFILNDRVAAIHWGEGFNQNWQVWGYHYLWDYSQVVPFDSTWAQHCSLIDGWF